MYLHFMSANYGSMEFPNSSGICEMLKHQCASWLLTRAVCLVWIGAPAMQTSFSLAARYHQWKRKTKVCVCVCVWGGGSIIKMMRGKNINR